jgi:hypothetical protein
MGDVGGVIREFHMNNKNARRRPSGLLYSNRDPGMIFEEAPKRTEDTPMFRCLSHEVDLVGERDYLLHIGASQNCKVAPADGIACKTIVESSNTMKDIVSVVPLS